ncbi:hypothetical protein MJO28_000653 [Puccinia striiformis f. sp. tritici]|uniref:Uncharacterized protein n=1 Tax=Puccinia striiformis f. sp. tritici TaxID=168172 RepID=A0ACC0EZQ7_9BASI|nr:hypothetical protein MJO28_000653 [Puccinia striiformis f. sp. tritici]
MDAVIEGFEALRIKHDSRLGDHRLASIASEPAQEATSAMSLGAFNWRNVLYDRLHSCLLPLLRHQLITLSTLLEPEGLQSDPELKLKPILELQPELDQNIFQIKYALAIVCPEPLCASDQADDQQLDQFKSYRVSELNEHLKVILFKVSGFCHEANQLIKKNYALCTGNYLQP